MARSAPLTAVSGAGMIIMGVTAVVGAYIAAQRRSVDWWIYVWLAVACVGCFTGALSLILKARRTQSANWFIASHKFALGLFPPIFAGIILTEIFYERSLENLMPGLWLLLYGVGVVSGGTFSVRVVPLMGLCFVALGIAAFYVPHADTMMVWGPLTAADALLVLGFGGLHILFGAIVAWKYGG